MCRVNRLRFHPRRKVREIRNPEKKRFTVLLRWGRKCVLTSDGDQSSEEHARVGFCQQIWKWPVPYSLETSLCGMSMTQA